MLAVCSALQVAEMTDETLLSISVNSLNALNFAANDLMTWQFDALELDANTQYAMMFVQYNENDSLQIVKGAVRLTVGTNTPAAAGLLSTKSQLGRPVSGDLYSRTGDAVVLGLGGLALAASASHNRHTVGDLSLT